MIRTASSILLASWVLAALPSSATASGGLGGGFPSAPPRLVDPAYEQGKALFRGRASAAEKIKYCVTQEDGEVKKLKRSTARPFRGGTVEAFATSLVDCKDPERLALTTMPRESVPFVLYYLNKRFKLELVDS